MAITANRFRSLVAGGLLAMVCCVALAQERFASVDRHALAADKDTERSVDALAAYLLKGARTDEEKARAIFRWMADRVDYDVKGYFSGDLRSVPPDGILNQRQAGCDGYATLFEALGRRMGLEVISVAGYAKGYGHKNTASFERPNHAWNAVRIDGRWMWVDATWGAGFVQEGTYIRKLAEHFFMVEPDRWVLTHLPATTLPQFDPPLQKAVFENLPNPDISLLGYRLPGSVLMATLHHPGFDAFVETFDQPPRLVEIESVPLHRRLMADTPAVFKLHSEAFEEIMAVTGDKWLRFGSNGHDFELSLSPPKGPLQIVGRKPGQQEYLPFLAYEVE